jgi:hypothetical protein
MVAHPLDSQSPFVAAPWVADARATPYMLALAELWRAVASAREAADPIAAARFLGYAGVLVSGVTLAMVGLYASRVAGPRAARRTVIVLLAVFGPAHVLSTHDLSLGGLLYSGFYGQNIALALALGTLLALACVLAGATMVVEPFMGSVLALVAAIDGCRRAVHGQPGAFRASAALSFGFVAGMVWPAFKLSHAMTQAGVPGAVLIAACVAAPRVAQLGASWLRRQPCRDGQWRRVAAGLAGDRGLLMFAIVGAVTVAALALWESLLLLSAPAGHQAVYWNAERWRWVAMLGAGAISVPGLVRLARDERPVPLIWFAGCYLLAVLGMAGAGLTAWPQLLLLCQVPMAIGAAVALLQAPGRARRLGQATIAFALVFKLVTLLSPAPGVGLLRSQVPPAYRIGRIVAAEAQGVVASDPATSLYLPAATGQPVLTVVPTATTWDSERAISVRGYALLHAFYLASPRDWWPPAQALWQAGVRDVLVNERVSLGPATVQGFAAGPPPTIRTAADRQLLGRMQWRLRRIAVLVYSDHQWALYRLSRPRLFGSMHKPERAATARPTRPAGSRRPGSRA